VSSLDQAHPGKTPSTRTIIKILNLAVVPEQSRIWDIESYVSESASSRVRPLWPSD